MRGVVSGVAEDLHTLVHVLGILGLSRLSTRALHGLGLLLLPP